MSNSPSYPASSAPLGYWCLAIAVFAFAAPLGTGTGLSSPTFTLFFVGGIGMLIAGIISFLRHDTFNATWQTAYGVLWPSTGFYLNYIVARSTPSNTDVSMWAIEWGIFTACMVLLSVRAKRPIASLSLLLFFIMFLCTWLASQFGMTQLYRCGSIAAVITAILAAIEGVMLLAARPTVETT